MYLLPGNSVEYKKRHDEIWPELAELLHQVGIQNYSIFLDESTRTLALVGLYGRYYGNECGSFSGCD
ncbi:MAG: L-rhamnose mutarotase [Bacteroidota bacterium]